MNMAVDEAILDAHLRGLTPPTLRIYRWQPAALSIGYFQSLEKDVDLELCRNRGIDVVRRLTGGRAVYHQDELTYAVVASRGYGYPDSIAQSYLLLNEGLKQAYRRLGLEVALIAKDGAPGTAACFAGAGTADLLLGTKKIAGSAQFRRGEAFLQHGSLPITLDGDCYLSLLKFPSVEMKEQSRRQLQNKATDIESALGRRIAGEELIQALREGFAEALGISFHDACLTTEEMVTSQRLREHKYQSAHWNISGGNRETT